jgi:hypothetical protein
MRFVWKDKEPWLPLLARTKGRRQNPAFMLDSLRRIYSDIAVFHAARPRDVQSYYLNGLRMGNHEALTNTAKKIFLGGAFPEINKEAFDKALSNLNGIDDCKLYVTLDDRFFLNHGGHYLIYGSEHICGIATGLSRNTATDYRQALKQFGIPTIFKLSLPLDMCEESDLKDLSELLCEWIPHVRVGRNPPEIDFTFLQRNDLAPERIIGHEHPTVINDPLLPMCPEYHYPEQVPPLRTGFDLRGVTCKRIQSESPKNKK